MLFLIQSVIILTGKCWGLICNKENITKTTFDSLVTNLLNEVKDDSLVLLPILANGNRIGDHWTLLRLDLITCEWTFFNPLRSRGTDHHLNSSFAVIDYVENYLRERFRAKYPKHKLLKRSLKKPKSSNCLQQTAGSLDCGIVVCIIIEKIILNRYLDKGKLTEDEAGDFRKKMVEYFLEPLEIEIK